MLNLTSQKNNINMSKNSVDVYFLTNKVSPQIVIMHHKQILQLLLIKLVTIRLSCSYSYAFSGVIASSSTKTCLKLHSFVPILRNLILVFVILIADASASGADNFDAQESNSYSESKPL